MRANCVKEAARFDKGFYIEKWIKLLSDFT